PRSVEIEVSSELRNDIEAEQAFHRLSECRRLRLFFGQALDLLAVEEEELGDARWHKGSHEFRPELRVDIVELLAALLDIEAFRDADRTLRVPAPRHRVRRLDASVS